MSMYYLISNIFFLDNLYEGFSLLLIFALQGRCTLLGLHLLTCFNVAPLIIIQDSNAGIFFFDLSNLIIINKITGSIVN